MSKSTDSCLDKVTITVLHYHTTSATSTSTNLPTPSDRPSMSNDLFHEHAIYPEHDAYSYNTSVPLHIPTYLQENDDATNQGETDATFRNSLSHLPRKSLSHLSRKRLSHPHRERLLHLHREVSLHLHKKKSLHRHKRNLQKFSQKIINFNLTLLSKIYQDSYLT